MHLSMKVVLGQYLKLSFQGLYCDISTLEMNLFCSESFENGISKNSKAAAAVCLRETRCPNYSPKTLSTTSKEPTIFVESNASENI